MFELALIFTLLSYFFQLNKTYKTKEASGVSLNGYTIYFINLAGYIFWSNGDVGVLKTIELFLHTATMVYVIRHTQKARFEKGDAVAFGVALFASINLISGVAQAFKSYKNISPKDVSFMTYFSLFMANMMFLVLAFNDHEPLNIFVGLVGTNTVYSYILYKVYRDSNRPVSQN